MTKTKNGVFIKIFLKKLTIVLASLALLSGISYADAPNFTYFFPANNQVLPGTEQSIQVSYSASAGINTSSVYMYLYKWDGTDFGDDISFLYVADSNVTSTGATFDLSGLAYGIYRYDVVAYDNSGNRTEAYTTFYVDEPQVVLNNTLFASSIGPNLDGDEMIFNVGTIGVPYSLSICKETDFLNNSGTQIYDWNGTTGVGYKTSPYTGSLLDIPSNQVFASNSPTLNASGELLTYEHRIKIQSFLQNNQAAGKYQMSLALLSEFDYSFSNSGAINGQCYTAAGVGSENAPTFNLCSSSADTPQVTSSGSFWTWECSGDSGGSTSVCFAPIMRTNQSCTGLPNNASWNTASSVTQVWDGTQWIPTLTGSYNENASTVECRFICNSNYTWNSTTGTCDVNDPAVPSMIYNPAGPAWTNQPVTATLIFNMSGATITNNSGSNVYTFTQNGTFVFNYYYTPGTPLTATASVSWVDTDAPNTFVPTVFNVGYSEFSVSAEGLVTDVGPSGINPNAYLYSLDGGTTRVGPYASSRTFTGLESGAAYTVLVRAFDNAGNYTDSYPVFVSTVSLGSGLPIFIAPDGDGNYFTFGNMPTGNTYIGNDFSGNTFTFVLVKPASISNSGMNNYSFSTYPITNASSIQWTTGQATASIIAGTFNSASPVFNPTTATTVNPGGNVSITLNVQAKIDVAVIDEVRTSVSYLMPSVDQTRRYFYIEFFWIPYNGYMLAYNSNGGSGSVPASVCIAYTSACTPKANAFTNSGYTFAGWGTDPNGPVQFLPGANIPANTFTRASQNTLYAIWQ